jgi:flagellar motor component MotA
MRFRVVLSVVITVVFFAAGIWMTGNPLFVYIDLFTFLFVPLLPHFLLSLIVPLSEQRVLLREVLSRENRDREILRKAAACLVSLKRMVITSTVATMVMGTIGIMVNLEDPHALGPNLAVALISLFYGTVYILAVIEPFRLAAETKLAGESESSVQ